MRVTFDGHSTTAPVIGKAERLRDFVYFSRRGGFRFYDVSPDPDRLMLLTRGDAAQQLNESLRQINVVVNWSTELAGLVRRP
jgi:hypothetical protein